MSEDRGREERNGGREREKGIKGVREGERKRGGERKRERGEGRKRETQTKFMK